MVGGGQRPESEATLTCVELLSKSHKKNDTQAATEVRGTLTASLLRGPTYKHVGKAFKNEAPAANRKTEEHFNVERGQDGARGEEGSVETHQASLLY